MILYRYIIFLLLCSGVLFSSCNKDKDESDLSADFNPSICFPPLIPNLRNYPFATRMTEEILSYEGFIKFFFPTEFIPYLYISIMILIIDGVSPQQKNHASRHRLLLVSILLNVSLTTGVHFPVKLFFNG